MPWEDVRDEPNARGVLDISIFTDPHLESAARTFQVCCYAPVSLLICMLTALCPFSGPVIYRWYTRPHRELVQKHLENVKSGKLHTPWKDDVWGQNHDAPDEDQEGMSLDPSASPKGKGRGFVLHTLSFSKFHISPSCRIRGNAFEPLIKHNLLAVGERSVLQQNIHCIWRIGGERCSGSSESFNHCGLRILMYVTVSLGVFDSPKDTCIDNHYMQRHEKKATWATLGARCRHLHIAH